MASSSTFDPLEEQDKEKPKAMSIQVMEPKKDIDHVTYQVMTKVSLLFSNTCQVHNLTNINRPV
jgi:hypothetical protein